MNPVQTQRTSLLIINSTLIPQLVELLNASIAINLTAFDDVDFKSSAMVFIGSKMEMALSKSTKDLGWANYNLKDIWDATDIVLMIPFLSKHKSMGCVVRLPAGAHCLFMKGASELHGKACAM
jgi:Ca2+-transporting ATPase